MGNALADELVYFHAPAGNITCLISLGEYAEARCDMKHLTPSFTAAPVGCALNWGKSFSIAADDPIGQIPCVGDAAIDPAGAVLGYGETISLWMFTCTSRKSGITCTNGSGHGFTISKAKQTLF
jgi:hypothetical protein